MDNEIKETAERMRKASALIAEQSKTLQDAIDELTVRIDAIEEGNRAVASALVKNDQRIGNEQEVQDVRITELEP